MDISVLRKAVHDLPFRPFVLTMNDGREFEIFHPDWIFVYSGHVTIIDEDNQRAIYLEPILIASIAVSEAGGPATSDFDIDSGSPST